MSYRQVVQVPLKHTFEEESDECQQHRQKKRTKAYIAFDGDTDLMSYRTIRLDADPKYPFVLNDAHEINWARDDSLPQSIINELRRGDFASEQTSRTHFVALPPTGIEEAFFK